MGSETIHREPPCSIEAEMACLGAALISESACGLLLELLEERDFYHRPHRLVFAAIAALVARDAPVDLFSVPEELKNTEGLERGELPRLEAVGGVPYINDLADSVPTAAHCEHYAHIVKEKSLLRQLIAAGQEIIDRAYAQEVETEEIVAQAHDLVLKVGESTGRNEAVVAREVALEWAEYYCADDESAGIQTGIAAVDYILAGAGFQGGDFVVVPGRPGMGKTNITAIEIAINVATRGTPVYVFSCEMRKRRLMPLFLANLSGENSREIAKRTRGRFDKARYHKALERFSGLPLHIIDRGTLPVMSLSNIRGRLKRMFHQHGPGLVIIDQLSLIDRLEREDNTNQGLDRLGKGLKTLAETLDIPIITPHQLSREVEKMPDKMPLLSHLREGGNIEGHADIVMALMRPRYYTPELALLDDHGAESDQGRWERVRCRFLKNRAGVTGEVPLWVDLTCSRWKSQPGWFESLAECAPPEDGRLVYS